MTFGGQGSQSLSRGSQVAGRHAQPEKSSINWLIRSAMSILSARQPSDIERVIHISNERPHGTYVIDDFHRLSPDVQEKLADMAKLAAEQGEVTQLPKLVVIGINQVGASLIQMVPDIAKRCGIHRIEPGTKDTIQSLVAKGCELLNIDQIDSEMIFNESQGDYWLSQHLCQALFIINNMLIAFAPLNML